MIRGLILALALTVPGALLADCRQALALGLDISGSVDSREYALQIGGLTAALTDPEVADALLAMPGAPVRLAVFEWSGPHYQRQILRWTEITDRQTLDAAIATIGAAQRGVAPPGTALGSAMQFGAALLERSGRCWKRTLDISGDGKHNLGPHPRDVKTLLDTGSLTLNALVIGADAPATGDNRQIDIAELSSYFRAWVILGPDAFVETALGFEDYESAMVRKLKRELEGLVISAQ